MLACGWDASEIDIDEAGRAERLRRRAAEDLDARFHCFGGMALRRAEVADKALEQTGAG